MKWSQGEFYYGKSKSRPNKKPNAPKPDPKENNKEDNFRASYGDKPMDEDETRDVGQVKATSQYNDYEDVDMESPQEIDSSRRDMSQSVGGRRGGGSPPNKKKAESELDSTGHPSPKGKDKERSF